MYKGIFWCYVSCFDDDLYSHTVLPVRVKCDINGKEIENVEYSSKSGENFNHEIEWRKLAKGNRKYRNKPFDFYPRGRVELKNGKVKIFANPTIIEDEEALALIIRAFELESVKSSIELHADNSKHYRYAEDAMDSMAWLEDDDTIIEKPNEDLR